MNENIKFPILLFDGVCNLCNASVQWVLLRDRRATFSFAALQSETGRRLLEERGLNDQYLDTVVLVDHDRVYTRSDAAIETATRLGGWWKILSIFRFIPRPLRDGIYNWVAGNRYRWFGRQETCMLPRPEWKNRFL